jgi:hypothetical protein
VSEGEDLVSRALVQVAGVKEVLRMARKLRKRAEDLEKASDRLRAAAARELADYLEEAADRQAGT